MRSVAYDSPFGELGLIPPEYLSCWSNFPLYILPPLEVSETTIPFGPVLLNNLYLVLPSQMHLLDCDSSPIQSLLHPSRLHTRDNGPLQTEGPTSAYKILGASPCVTTLWVPLTPSRSCNYNITMGT
ncbi:hypothetical protein B296_00038371 [Ensete ventricosum]|uniref:Uncharacterized protein n=1 Tax=Ensete ventricosum TaxID=4639 RepID=A0A426XS27_ENSVE|nr:hypothetical protein B296_00038371 [Ensete ventricosum]